MSRNVSAAASQKTNVKELKQYILASNQELDLSLP